MFRLLRVAPFVQEQLALGHVLDHLVIWQSFLGFPELDGAILQLIEGDLLQLLGNLDSFVRFLDGLEPSGKHGTLVLRWGSHDVKHSTTHLWRFGFDLEPHCWHSMGSMLVQ